jgi:prefoldin alpha subunit
MEENRELLFKFSMFEQQIQQLQQQLSAIEQGIFEMASINSSLDELVGAKDKEIFSPLGRGIFAKAKLLSEELLVDIGSKNFVKKSVPETKELIQEQIGKLEEVKNELNAELDKIGEELTKTMQEAQEKEVKEKNNHEHNHSHDHNCSCGEDCICEDEECGCENNKKL